MSTPQATPLHQEAKYAVDAAPAPVGPSVPMTANVDHNGLWVGKWKADLFGCFNHETVPTNCLIATFCPCVSLAQTLHRIGMYNFTHVLIFFAAVYGTNVLLSMLQVTAASMSVFNGVGWTIVSAGMTFWSWIALILQIATFVMFMIIRMRIRKIFFIPGTELEDCCLSFWCSCCILAQMATQADSYTPNECKFSPKDTLPGYNF